MCVERGEAGAGWLSLASSLMKDPVWFTAPLRLLLCHSAACCSLVHTGALSPHFWHTGSIDAVVLKCP